MRTVSIVRLEEGCRHLPNGMVYATLRRRWKTSKQAAAVERTMAVAVKVR